MQHHHEQMAEYECQQRPHDYKMPQAGIMKTTHHPRQPGKLHRLPDSNARKDRQHAQHKCGSVSVLLQRIVSFFYRRLGAEEKIVAHHRPHAMNVARRKQDLPIIIAEYLIAEIQQTASNINPHESQMPLQRATQPPANRKRFRPMQKILLRNFRSEAWKGAKDLQPAANQNEQRNRIHPMAEAHNERVLVNGFDYFAGL